MPSTAPVKTTRANLHAFCKFNNDVFGYENVYVQFDPGSLREVPAALPPAPSGSWELLAALRAAPNSCWGWLAALPAAPAALESCWPPTGLGSFWQPFPNSSWQLLAALPTAPENFWELWAPLR